MDPAVIGEALRCGRKGAETAPADQRARAALSYVYLLNDQVQEARHEAEAALAINPESLFVLEGIGYLLTLCGDWERGVQLSRKAVRLNPFHLPVVHAGLWLDALRRNDFEEAYWQSLKFSPQDLFWQPLMETVSLALLGRLEEARHAFARVLQLKPDFSEHCEWLVRRYIKSDELVQRVQDGLRLAGLPKVNARPARQPILAVE
jgi:tetratricopeptide (TPR) repeat protein